MGGIQQPKNFFRFFNVIGGFWTLRTRLLKFNYACHFNDEYELNPDSFVNDPLVSISFEAFKKECEKIPPLLPWLSKETYISSLYNEYKKQSDTGQCIERKRLIFRHFRENDLVLCLTREIQSLNMWNNYAQYSEGIAIEFQVSRERDNVFGLAKPIRYIDDYPKLHESFF